MNDLRLRKLSAVLCAFTALGIMTSTGKAQTANTAPSTTTTTTTASTVAANPEQQPVVLEKYVVTGSNIPQAADALAIPVAVVDNQVIQDSGVFSDTLDILRKVAPNISGIGQENAQIDTASNFGGAQVSLKGLPTLVLVDGRRVANDPAEATGGAQFVDLNLIPPAAIERVEVLQDGASAIYGSDAIGGVINIILKKDYNGWETGAHYGLSTAAGHYEERSGYLVGGVSNDKTSITVSFDYAQHDQLFLADRPYTNPIYGTYTPPEVGAIEVYDNTSGSDNFYQLVSGVAAPPGGAQYTLQQLITMGIYKPVTTTQEFQTFNLADGETLIGNVVTDATSTAATTLSGGSTLTGTIDKSALTLDSSSTWKVTGNSVLTTVSDTGGIAGGSITNIVGNGHTVTYDPSLAANSALGGKTYSLAGGGELVPA